MASQQPRLLLTAALRSWIALLVVRYILVPLGATRKLPGLLLYMFFYEFCLDWLNL